MLRLGRIFGKTFGHLPRPTYSNNLCMLSCLETRQKVKGRRKRALSPFPPLSPLYVPLQGYCSEACSELKPDLRPQPDIMTDLTQKKSSPNWMRTMFAIYASAELFIRRQVRNYGAIKSTRPDMYVGPLDFLLFSSLFSFAFLPSRRDTRTTMEGQLQRVEMPYKGLFFIFIVRVCVRVVFITESGSPYDNGKKIWTGW